MMVTDKASQIKAGGALQDDLNAERIQELLDKVQNVETKELSLTDIINPAADTMELFGLGAAGQQALIERYQNGISVIDYLTEKKDPQMLSALEVAGSKIFSVKFSGSINPFGIEIDGCTLCEIRHGFLYDIHGTDIGR